jgi:hypothetical protein
MLRQDTIICGTTTTGTGTLTLAACPAPPGGIDLYQWLTATGFGFVNGNAVIVSYVLIEYSDTTFSTAVNFEKGIGTVTLGASLSATTLARTTVQSVGATLNTTGSPTYASPSAVSIGTAANVLVFVGPSAADVPAYSPYYDTTTSGIDAAGLPPVCVGYSTGSVLTTLTDYYSVFEWRAPMLVKRASVYVNTGYSGTSGTAISAAYARIYQINSAGRPGKLLYDFGAFSGTNPLNTSSTVISTSASAGNGFLLLPGEYYFDFMPSFSGAGGTVSNPKLTVAGTAASAGRMGTVNGAAVLEANASGGTAGAGPDPANLTSYAAENPTGVSPHANRFMLAPS